jgi:hypothetical protein
VGVVGRFGGPGGDLLFHALRRSTIGAEGFHGRVRDGIGCFAPRYGHQAGQDRRRCCIATPSGDRRNCVPPKARARASAWATGETQFRREPRRETRCASRAAGRLASPSPDLIRGSDPGASIGGTALRESRRRAGRKRVVAGSELCGCLLSLWAHCANAPVARRNAVPPEEGCRPMGPGLRRGIVRPAARPRLK